MVTTLPARILCGVTWIEAPAPSAGAAIANATTAASANVSQARIVNGSLCGRS